MWFIKYDKAVALEVHVGMRWKHWKLGDSPTLRYLISCL
jgi:hypothetical protein